jgi:hypothetical protein
MSGGGGTKMVESSSRLPAEYENFANQSLSVAGTVANMPHIQYGQDRIAGFSGDEMAGFDAMRNAATAYQQTLGQATDALGGLASGAGDVTANQGVKYLNDYQNPFTEQVVDSTLNDMNRAYTMGLGQLGGGSAAAGAFGGSRQGVAEGEAMRNYIDRVGATTGQLRAQGFNTAAGLGMQDANRFLTADQGNQTTKLAAANSLGNLANVAQNLGMTGANALMGIGQQQRGMDQSNMDLAYADWLEQMNAPIRNLSIRQSALGMTPMGSIQRTPVQTSGMDVGGLLGGFGGLLGGAAKIGAVCWVAREVYGEANPTWKRFRLWMLTKAPVAFTLFYLDHGPAVANDIRDRPEVKARIRAGMDAILAA